MAKAVSNYMIRKGTVVRDSLRREGIVLSEDSGPPGNWLAEQADRRLADLPSGTRWWSVLVLHGGMVLVPEPLAQAVRMATYDDFLIAVDHGSPESRLALAKLFPEFVQRAMAKVDGSK